MTNRTEKPIADATEAELKAFATEALGLELFNFDRGEKLIAKIRAAWDKPYILVDAEGPVPADTPQPRMVRTAEKDDEIGSDKTIIIQIPASDAHDGNEPVPVGVNGRVMLIPRDRWCRVRTPYYEVLKNAVQSRFDPLPDGGLGPERKVLLYPFQVWTDETNLPDDLLEQPPSMRRQSGEAA